MADVQMSNGQQTGENGGESFLESLNIPATVTKRVNALKNLQRRLLEVEAKFYEEIHILECKYAALYEPLFQRREQIVNGEYEPTEEESKWALDDESRMEEEKDAESKDVTDLVKDLKSKVSLNESATAIKGIPDFWLHTFKSTDLIAEMIQEYDEPVLKHLRDVRVRMHEQKPYGYTIEFHFNENEFFTDKVLTKTYELSTEVDDKDPFAFDGPVLYKSTGCTINWTKGKDVTVRLVKKKQKHKSSGVTRIVQKEEKQDSFFNYFESPTADGLRPSDPRSKKPAGGDKDEEEDEDDENLCEADFEIGQFLKDFLVPKAVLYFTGELVDSASYDEYDEEDDDEEGDEDDDEDGHDDEDEEEPVEEHHAKKSNGRNGRGGDGGVQKRSHK